MSHWQNQVCVVTGAASGIGAAIARHALSEGMTVYAADVDAVGLQSLQDQTGTTSLQTVSCDVTKENDLLKLAEQVFSEQGQVNLLFNNAGIMIDGKTWERSTADWRWTLDVNVMGVVHGIQAFVPRMLAQGKAGRVVNTSSIGGLLGGAAHMGLYQGSKHMVTAISESLYQELQQEEAMVSVSVLCPAEVATAIAEPERLGQVAARSDDSQAFHGLLASGINAGMSPDDLVPLVFQAIVEGKFWLLPQPAFKPVLQQRCTDMLNESNPDAGMAAMLDE